MLVKLLPEQASHHWPIIRDAIEAALPPFVGMQSDRMQNILKAILLEEVTVWVSVEKAEGFNKITALTLTNFLYDEISGTKSLLIYCVYGFGNSSETTWKEGYETLKKFAKGKGCHRILAYTDIPSLKKYAEKLGAEARYTLIAFNLVEED